MKKKPNRQTALLTRNLVLAAGCMAILLLSVFIIAVYNEIRRDYRIREDSIIAYTEAGIRNIEDEFEDNILNIKRLDLYIANVIAADQDSDSLHTIGRSTAAIHPNLHGIIKTNGSEILDYYAHTGNGQVFERGLRDFLVDYKSSSNIHFFSVKYSNSSKSLEVAHRVSMPQCDYIFVYEINNSHVWENGSPVNSLRNSYYIYDCGLDSIVPRTMAYISTSQMKEELKKGASNGVLTANISGSRQIIVYDRCEPFNCYIFSSAQMDTFRTFAKNYLRERIWVLVMLPALILILGIMAWILFIMPLRQTEDLLCNGLLKDESLPPQKSNALLFSPMIDTVYSAKETMMGLEEQKYRERFLKEEARIITLQSQINPHFMYNSLESVRALAVLEGAREAAMMTKALANYFRYTINRGGSIVALYEELNNVENYMTIQNFRFQNRFEFVKEYNEADASLMDSKICKMTLQPIVENAVFHGLEPKRGSGKLTIQIFRTQKNLIIIVKDDGVGIPGEQLMKLNERFSSTEEYKGERPKHGIALTNVNQRIKIYFGSDYGLYLYSKEGAGTEAEITLPLVFDTEEAIRNGWFSGEDD